MYALPKGNDSAGAGDVNFRAGMALIHRGQHQHQAQELTSGQRVDLVRLALSRRMTGLSMPFKGLVNYCSLMDTVHPVVYKHIYLDLRTVQHVCI